MPHDDKDFRKEFVRGLALFTHVGFTIVLCVAIGVFLGKFLDDRLGTTPWLIIGCSFLGLGAGFKSIFDLLNKK